jgi:hypothetical protein
LVGHALIGWSRIDAQDPLLRDFSELIGELDATWIASSRTRFRFVAERSPEFAVTGATTYYLDTLGLIRAVHYFTGVIGGEVAVRRRRLDFPDALVGPTRQDRISHYEAGVRLRLYNGSDGKRVEYSLTLGRYRQDSNIPGFNQERTTFGLGAVLGF